MGVKPVASDGPGSENLTRFVALRLLAGVPIDALRERRREGVVAVRVHGDDGNDDNALRGDDSPTLILRRVRRSAIGSSG